MPYLIDGHNLIPKVAGLSLKAVDDEMQLIELLQEFCRIGASRWRYFDNSPPGQPGSGAFGPVTARFVREGRTADDAIAARLKRLGRSARNWTVVSPIACRRPLGKHRPRCCPLRHSPAS